jgi:hypothetical protein
VGDMILAENVRMRRASQDVQGKRPSQTHGPQGAECKQSAQAASRGRRAPQVPGDRFHSRRKRVFVSGRDGRGICAGTDSLGIDPRSGLAMGHPSGRTSSGERCVGATCNGRFQTVSICQNLLTGGELALRLFQLPNRRRHPIHSDQKLPAMPLRPTVSRRRTPAPADVSRLSPQAYGVWAVCRAGGAEDRYGVREVPESAQPSRHDGNGHGQRRGWQP